MEHKVTVCASGALGISNLNFYIDLGNPNGSEDRKSLNDIKEEIITRSICAGYTAILHYTKIDDCEDAVTFLRMDSEALSDAYINRLDKRLVCQNEIKEIEARDDDWSKKYGQGRIDFLKGVIKESEYFFRFTKEAYELIGIDVNDRERKRRVLDNLGFNRV